MSADGSRDRAPRVESALRPAPEDSFALYEARVGSIVPMHATAAGDQALADDLLGRPTYRESVAALEEPRHQRASLAHLLMLQAEDQLLAPAGAPLMRAALAQRILDRLVERGDERARQHAPLASWLLGKSLLGAGHPRLAHAVFHDMRRLAGTGSEEDALRLVGLAQAHEDLRRAHPDAADVLWLLAARQFTRLDAVAPRAACQVQLGLWLLATGDRINAATALGLAADSLDSGFAPSLTARVHLALAGVHAGVGNRRAAASHLSSARRLYALASSPAETISRAWAEARIAAISWRNGRADLLYGESRTALLARGSLAEAARVTWDHVMLCLATGRASEVEELTDALAVAFPERGASLALAMGETARSALAQPEESYRICGEMRRHLDRVRPGRGRPPLLVSSRLLADRLLRRRGEQEGPIGAAPEGL